ncbi:helix-turn-helix domain-containing protein [Anaeromicropila herbilytica]|uniref:Helix-turn-helix domain-containing protein n=1 Tax=Anaeromicropila herbilytica TaxID=2785025 RepID=A0A7R7EIX4_9FIRM|nr:helix-turn-helix domain-containing protein [Anaeromicropila herbilytica]BCN29549.1 hypothetical protein bsdtb5_08440 [Anaeromicropila herbilytica]
MSMKKFKMLNIICASCDLSSKEKLVAQYFIYKSNKSGECYPSVYTIARACGASERTIQRATKKLQEKGFISIIERYVEGKQTSNQYCLNTLLIAELEREKEVEKENKAIVEKESKFEDVVIEYEDLFEVEEEKEIDDEYLKNCSTSNSSNVDNLVDKVVDIKGESDYEDVEVTDYDLLDNEITKILIIESNEEYVEENYKEVDQDVKGTFYSECKSFNNWRKKSTLSFNTNIIKKSVNQGNIEEIKYIEVVVNKKIVKIAKIIRRYIHTRKEPKLHIKFNREQAKQFWEWYLDYGDIENIYKCYLERMRKR